MDSSERIVYQYLSYQGFSDVAYEPDGNVPPDFLLNGRIAVEVRRLNQNEDTGELLATLGRLTAAKAGSSYASVDRLRRGINWQMLSVPT